MITSNLVLPIVSANEDAEQYDQKFVVIRLSNGETHFISALRNMTVNGKHHELLHREIVHDFCAKHGFVPIWKTESGTIKEAKNNEGVTLKIEGGGLIKIHSTWIEASIESGDYGPADDAVIKECILVAAKTAGIHGCQVYLQEEKFTID